MSPSTTRGVTTTRHAAAMTNVTLDATALGSATSTSVVPSIPHCDAHVGQMVTVTIQEGPPAPHPRRALARVTERDSRIRNSVHGVHVFVGMRYLMVLALAAVFAAAPPAGAVERP